MSQPKKAGPAHSPDLKQRASNHPSRITEAEREADEAVEGAFLYMLTWMQRQHAAAEHIASVVMYHTTWQLRKKTITILKEAVSL